MFAEAIHAGLAAGERTLSKNEARDVISGGLLRFLIEYFGSGDLEKCAEHLYYVAKASDALSGTERDTCLSSLMFCTRLDGQTDPEVVKRQICAFLDIDEGLLEKIIAVYGTKRPEGRC